MKIQTTYPIKEILSAPEFWRKERSVYDAGIANFVTQGWEASALLAPQKGSLRARGRWDSSLFLSFSGALFPPEATLQGPQHPLVLGGGCRDEARTQRLSGGPAAACHTLAL